MVLLEKYFIQAIINSSLFINILRIIIIFSFGKKLRIFFKDKGLNTMSQHLPLKCQSRFCSDVQNLCVTFRMSIFLGGHIFVRICCIFCQAWYISSFHFYAFFNTMYIWRGHWMTITFSTGPLGGHVVLRCLGWNRFQDEHNNTLHRDLCLASKPWVVEDLLVTWIYSKGHNLDDLTWNSTV